MAISDLESTLGLRFKDQGLLQQALVHRSYLNEQGGSTVDSYERMEFLGDAVLELVISTELYRCLPQVTEGELTKGRSALVCRPSLAKVARRLYLGDYLSLGKGEKSAGGQQRESILEEAFEAVVAAVYLDQGFEAARQFILRALEPELAEYCRLGIPPENPKSQLQETIQGQGRSTPHYRVISIEGPPHQPVFTVDVLVDDEFLGRGSGTKKTDAERAAAQEALARYETDSEVTPKSAGVVSPVTPAKVMPPGSSASQNDSALPLAPEIVLDAIAPGATEPASDSQELKDSVSAK